MHLLRAYSALLHACIQSTRRVLSFHACISLLGAGQDPTIKSNTHRQEMTAIVCSGTSRRRTAGLLGFGSSDTLRYLCGIMKDTTNLQI